VGPGHSVDHTVELAAAAVEHTDRGPCFQPEYTGEMRRFVRRQVDHVADSFGIGRVESDGHVVE
jgi:hypothetical protein